jgi:hypothetical protein
MMAVQLVPVLLYGDSLHPDQKLVNGFSNKSSIKGNFKDLQDGDYLE